MTDEQYEPKPGDLVKRRGVASPYVVVKKCDDGQWLIVAAGRREHVSADSLRLAPEGFDALSDVVQSKFGDTGPNGG